jgi:hypothetical protein
LIRARLLLLAAVALAAVPAIVRAQEPDEGGLKRIRAGLDRPSSKLIVPEVRADFRVHVEARRPLQDIFDVPAWATPPVGWQPPSLGFDLLSVVRTVAANVAEAKRGHEERLAREEVQRAIAAYCADLSADDPRLASVDGRERAGQICATSAAIR